MTSGAFMFNDVLFYTVNNKGIYNRLLLNIL